MEARESSRQEIAKRLRKMAKKHAAVEASRVARAIGLEYKVYGTVVAFTSADVQDLADLIDPTCELEDAGDVPASVKDNLITFFCSECGSPVYNDMTPSYCPYCGARVVDE